MVDWKKEIKLSDLVGPRKKDAEREPASPASDAPEPVEKTSIWKKEINLRSKRDSDDALVVEEQSIAIEPVGEPTVVAEGEAPAAPNVAAAPQQPAASETPQPATAQTLPSENPAPAPVAGPALPSAGQLPTAEVPTPQAQPTVAVPAPEPHPAATVAPAGTQPVETPAAPVPQVVHPPVPADQLPPLPEDDERKPFYKRDISFGRKRDTAAAPEAPRRERARKQTGGRSRRVPKSLVGLKIGASQIAAARVANNGHAELVQIAREPLEPGVIVGGELRDPDALAESLKEFFRRHKLPKRGVRLGIANNRIGVRTFEIVGIDDPKQLTNAIRFRAQEALPIPIEEAVLDYQILSEARNDEGETARRILLVVAYRELVDRYVSACRKAGITLNGIDLEAFALLRALGRPREEDTPADAALVAVTIGHERSTFAVSDGRTCEFTRVLEWGGSALNVAIARALDIAPSEAEPIKLELSLFGSEVPAGLSEAQAGAAREAIARQIQSFARELVSSLQFYQNQPGSLGIGEIAITGGTAHLPGLAQELQRLIGVTVRVGDPLSRVKVGKKFGEPEQVGSFAVAIGLGIED